MRFPLCHRSHPELMPALFGLPSLTDPSLSARAFGSLPFGSTSTNTPMAPTVVSFIGLRSELGAGSSFGSSSSSVGAGSGTRPASPKSGPDGASRSDRLARLRFCPGALSSGASSSPSARAQARIRFWSCGKRKRRFLHSPQVTCSSLCVARSAPRRGKVGRIVQGMPQAVSMPVGIKAWV